MTTKDVLIANQLLNANINRKIWGNVFYNVKDYMAKGIGSDDTEYIQSAIDDALSNGGSAVFFPAGTYSATSLTNLNDVDLFGDNVTLTVGGEEYKVNSFARTERNSILYNRAIEDISSSIPKNSLNRALEAVRAGTLRVMWVGDSITYGADMLSARNAYSSRVEEDLKNALPGVNVITGNYALGSRRIYELMNPAFVGMATPPPDPLQGFSMPWSTVGKSWLDSVKDFKPDLLIVAFGMNDSYAVTKNADEGEANNLASLITTVSGWTPAPSMVLVPTMLPSKDKSRGTTQDQNIMQSIARATREVGKNYGVTVADANRLFRILRDGKDDVSRAATQETNFQGYYDSSMWVGNIDQFTYNGGMLTPNDAAPKLVTRTRKFYNGIIQFDFKPVNSTDTGWIYYRSYGDNYGALILFIDPPSGHIGIYNTDGSLLADVGGLSMPLNQFQNISIDVKGTKHIVKFNGNTIIDATIYKKLHDGSISFGSLQSSVTFANLSITYDDPIESEAAYTEDELLGKFNSFDSGNGLNHPSALGTAVAYAPAFNGIIRALTQKQSQYEAVYSVLKTNIAAGATVDVFGINFNTNDFQSVYVEITSTGIMQGIGTRIVTSSYHVYWDANTSYWDPLTNYARGGASDKISHVTTNGANGKISVLTCGTAGGSDLKVSMRVIGTGFSVKPL